MFPIWRLLNKDFAYRTTISWWILAVAAGGALSLALLTISIKSLRAAKGNPTDALRRD